MLKLRKIAITGTPGSGKSTVLQFFREMGACVVNADQCVSELLTPQTTIGKRVIALLGDEIVQEGKISKKKIADKVFVNPKLLQELEKLLHPAVLQAVENQYEDAKKSGKYLAFVAEIPLLFEIGAEKFFDISVVVTAEENLITKRMQKRGWTKKDRTRRMARQMAREEKEERGDFILENNTTLEALKEATELLWQKISQKT